MCHINRQINISIAKIGDIATNLHPWQVALVSHTLAGMELPNAGSRQCQSASSSSSAAYFTSVEPYSRMSTSRHPSQTASNASFSAFSLVGCNFTHYKINYVKQPSAYILSMKHNMANLEYDYGDFDLKDFTDFRLLLYNT